MNIVVKKIRGNYHWLLVRGGEEIARSCKGFATKATAVRSGKAAANRLQLHGCTYISG